MFKRYLNDRSGFTLVEAVTVLGVLAVVTAVLMVNNRASELQINLNTDIANISNAISRAKALTLQGVGAPAVCGYGVSFAQGTNDQPDTYTIYSYTDCVNWSGGKPIVGQGGINDLSAGLRMYTSGTDQFIKNVNFYSSDAKVKLFNFAGQSICESGCDVTSSAGIIVIETTAIPTSYTTIKISTTGQVASKPGFYANLYNFNSGIETVNLTTGETKQNISDQGSGGSGATFNENNGSCVPNCFCSLSLASGQTCSDGCGGICYAGCGNNCFPGCDPGQTNPHNEIQNNSCVVVNSCGVNNCGSAPLPSCTGCTSQSTCSDTDSCGAPCVVCNTNNSEFCINGSCQVCSCVPDASGNTCGQCGGNCKVCAQPGYSCADVSGTWSCIPGSEATLKLQSVYPNTGFK